MFQSVPIHRVRSFWDARPCNLRHSDAELGSREYFDQVEAKKYRVEPHIPRFADFPRWNGRRVLELGCGIGTDTMNFARAGAQVTAVDLSSASLAIARKRAAVLALPPESIEFIHGNIERLDEVLPSRKYDLIYAFGVLHHTPCPDRALEQIRKFVKSSGTVKLMVYHRYSWKALSIFLQFGRGRFWQLPSLLAEYSEAQTGCPVTYSYSKRGIRRLLARHGLSITHLSIEHIFPYQIESYKRHQYRKTWYFRLLPPSLFRWLEHHFGWHLCITTKPI